MARKHSKTVKTPFPNHPARRAVLRGLAMVLPPLLTIVIFVWVGNTVAVYLLEPLEKVTRSALSWSLADIRERRDLDVVRLADAEGSKDGVEYRQAGDGKFVPRDVYDEVEKNPGPDPIASAEGIYLRFVEIQFLQRQFVVPIFVCLFILLLYFLGRFLAAGVGKFFWGTFERGIHQLPVVRNVYSSVKQVTDFLFSGTDVEYTRVIAVEYPRTGIWSLGMVTGESMTDISRVTGETMMSVLIPTSPMPFTGFTVTVKKSETIDLNITIEQAFQFIVSCGVVVPPHQIQEALDAAVVSDGNATDVETGDNALPAPTGDSK